MADRPLEATDADPLEALRARRAQRIAPVRFHLVEALARRVAAHEGAARRVLDARLAARMQSLVGVLDLVEASGEVEGAERSPEVDGGPGRTAGRGRGPAALAGLLADLAGRKPVAAVAPPARAPGVAAERALPAEADPLQYFRSTWSRLNADQRLAQSRAALPDNAGPLNSQHLVHRAMTLMRELSPEYLERFVSHVDALLWVEQANETAAREAGLPRPGPIGKPSRGRPA